MSALPTLDDIEAIRADITEYLIRGGTIDLYTQTALAQFKIDLEDTRNIEFSHLYASSAYLSTRNQIKCINMLSHLTVSLVFRDYAINPSRQGQWWDLANEYEARYQTRLKTTRLDLDLNEDGLISESEESQSPQGFFSS